MAKKNLSHAILVGVLFFLVLNAFHVNASDLPPQVYINDMEVPITVQKGDQVKVPLFFVGGSSANCPVELYIWTEAYDRTFCLSGDEGWVEVSDHTACPHLGIAPSMPSYFYFCWDAFSASESDSLSDFILHVCIDKQIDHVFTPESAYCGTQEILFQGPDCSNATVTIYPLALGVGPISVGDETEQTVSVIDQTGNPVSFEVVAGYPPWVNPSCQAEGQLLLKFQSDGLTPGQHYEGTLDIRTTDGCDKEARMWLALDVASTTADNSTGTSPWGDWDGNSGLIPTPSDDGTCSSLRFRPVGSASIAQSSVTETLELGQPVLTITLDALACGKPATVSSVKKASSGNAWLSASEGGGKVILNLDAGASDVKAGSTYKGTINVVADGIAGSLGVTLKIEGTCNATSASVDPESLSFQAYVGQNPSSAKTIYVKDNCGHAVSATVVSKPAWVTLMPTGTTGVFSVSCLSSGLSVDSYRGIITLRDGKYDQEHSVSVTLEVTDTPASSPPDDVETVVSGETNYYDLSPGEILYFKFLGYVPDSSHPIYVSSVSRAGEPKTVDMLIRKGRKPTLADRDLAYSGGNCSHWYDDIGWYPEKPSGAEDLYYCIRVGTTEFVKIDKPMGSVYEQDTFYIMLYNSGDDRVRYQRLIATY